MPLVPAKFIGPTFAGTSDSNTIDAKISGDVWQLPAGPMQYAAGYQWSKGTLTTNPSAALFTGDIAGLGGATPPIDRETGRSTRSTPSWRSRSSSRSISTCKAVTTTTTTSATSSRTRRSMRWQPATPYLFRASYNTGFRPPTLADLWLPQTLGTSEQFTDPAFPHEHGRPGAGAVRRQSAAEARNVEAMADRRASGRRRPTSASAPSTSTSS